MPAPFPRPRLARSPLAPLSLALLPLACRLDPPDPSSLASPAAQATPRPRVETIPKATDGEAMPVSHFVVRSPALLSARSVALVKGELSDAALRGLRDGAPPSSLESRLVPSLAFASGEGALAVVPSRPLSPGEAYTLAVGSASLRYRFVVRDPPLPRLARLFPPPASPSRLAPAVYCGDKPLPEGLEAAGAFPEGTTFTVQPGAPGAPGLARCVSLSIGSAPAAGPLAPPAALLSSGEPAALLEPEVLELGDPGSPSPAPTCAPPGVLFGPLCLEAMDDRVRLTPPPSPLLAALDAPEGVELLVLTGARVSVRGFSPLAHHRLEARFLDLSGVLTSASATFSTTEPMAHLVLNEVLADPLGPEPEAEWVELYNDGAGSVDLAGWSFGDAEGESPLPAVELLPGAFALLVNPGFSTDADQPVAPQALVLELPHLGKGGLSNQGEPLSLRSPDGLLASRFPPRPRPTRGASVARRSPGDDDEDQSAFVAAETPTPGAANDVARR